MRKWTGDGSMRLQVVNWRKNGRSMSRLAKPVTASEPLAPKFCFKDEEKTRRSSQRRPQPRPESSHGATKFKYHQTSFTDSTSSHIITYHSSPVMPPRTSHQSLLSPLCLPHQTIKCTGHRRYCHPSRPKSLHQPNRFQTV